MVATPLLRARAVSYRYPTGPTALAGVDFDLSSGELCVLIGPNGSGKSTLVRVLSGALGLQAGSVQLGERALSDWHRRERARALAVVPQFLRELHDLTVESFVLGGRYAHLSRWRGPARADVEAVATALADCDVAGLAARWMSELSGGQRQRVLIARALAQEARVLLVDEPTNSLDPEHQVQVFQLLSGLAERGRAVLVVTHDLNLAAQFGRRVCVLDRGRVHAQGAVETVICRAVLEPVYGPHLHYGELPGRDGMRRLVVPWLHAGS